MTTEIEPAAEKQVDSAGSVPLPALLAHLATLAAAGVVLLWVNRDQWFNADEWAMIVSRSLTGGDGKLGLLEPHNEHWSTIAVVVYRSLFAVFGVRTYTPFIAVMIVTHLVTCHLLWRVCLRAGVSFVVATFVVGIMAVLGAGWENLTWAFQFTLIGSVGAGAAALLCLPDNDDGWSPLRLAAVWSLCVLSLAFSGVGLVSLAVVLLAVLLTSGWRRVLVVGCVPGGTYLAWMLLYARDVEAVRDQPLREPLEILPSFLWKGLSATFEQALGIPGVGAVVVLTLALVVVRDGRVVRDRWALPVAAATGSIVFFTLTCFRRSRLGVEFAPSSRYLYVAFAFSVPLLALTVDLYLARANNRRWPLVLVLPYLLLVQLVALTSNADRSARIEQEQKRWLVASADIALAGEPIVNGRLSPEFWPDVYIDDMVSLARNGALPDIEPTPTDRLTAQAILQIAPAPAPAVSEAVLTPLELLNQMTDSPGEGCLEVGPGRGAVRADLSEAGALLVATVAGGDVSIAFTDDTAVGSPRTLPLAPGWNGIAVAVPGSVIVSSGSGATVCRSSSPPSSSDGLDT